MRHRHPLRLSLRAAKLSRSTFYYRQKAQDTVDKYAALKSRISAVYSRHQGRYGYRRITATLRQASQFVNHKTVQKLMRALGLKSLVRPKKYRSYWGEVGRVAPNLLARRFQADRPNQKWVTDVTEFKVCGQKLYLSPAMNLYDGEIVAYETSTSPLFGLVGSMLKKTMHRLSPGDTPLLHSDQGWQYQQPSYRRMLADKGLVQSMSRKANCLDNAAKESWFATLKTECFHLNRYDSVAPTAGDQPVHPLLQPPTHPAQTERPEPGAIPDPGLGHLVCQNVQLLGVSSLCGAFTFLSESPGKLNFLTAQRRCGR